jgi:mono/diheme cytochrome c family protein
MGRSAVNGILLVLLGVVVVLTWTLRRDFTERNTEFLPGMVESVPFDAQAANPNFPDGKTLRNPVPGTIARGFMPFPYDATPEGGLRAGMELHNPISDTLHDAVKRGAVVYTTFCQPCHGTGGLGDGPVAQRGFPPPPSLFAEKALKIKDGQMFHILTYGQANMPGLAAQISREDRWKVILKVRDMQRKATALAEGKE